MKKLQAFTHRERPFANLLKERLAAEGIACLLRNDELSSALGEIPFCRVLPGAVGGRQRSLAAGHAAVGEVAGRGSGNRPGMDLPGLR